MTRLTLSSILKCTVWSCWCVNAPKLNRKQLNLLPLKSSTIFVGFIYLLSFIFDANFKFLSCVHFFFLLLCNIQIHESLVVEILALQVKFKINACVFNLLYREHILVCHVHILSHEFLVEVHPIPLGCLQQHTIISIRATTMRWTNQWKT